MQPALRMLLEGILDYAGLFPPARLPLDEALANYRRYRATPEAWMLGRFVCPASRLAEIARLADDQSFAVSALARGDTSSSGFLAGLKLDLDDIAAFRNRHGEKAKVDVLEARLPGDVLDPTSPEAAVRLLTYAADLIDQHGPPSLTVYYEIPQGENRSACLPMIVTALAQARHFNWSAAEVRCRAPGLKVRCGGLEAAAFPAPEQLAAVLARCRETGVALKFTAGLHHPIRRRDTDLGVMMHGFLDVFAAAVLGLIHSLSEARLLDILTDTDGSHFRFNADSMNWKDLHAVTEQIQDARNRFAISFGSCSFEEPRDEIRPWVTK